MEKDWICTLEHTLREANHEASLARPLVVIHEASQLLMPKLHCYALGTMFPRGF